MKKMINIRRYDSEYANGSIKFVAEVTHYGLNKHKILTDRDDFMLENKIELLIQSWEPKWHILREKLEKEEKINNLENKTKHLNSNLKDKLDSINNILNWTLEIDDKVDWDSLKNFKPFSISPPLKPNEESVEAPDPNNSKFQPALDFWDNIFSGRRKRKVNAAERRYENALHEYRELSFKLLNENQKALNKYNNDLKKWNKRREDYENQKLKTNQKVDELKQKYQSKDQDAIIEYCTLVLNNSSYISEFPQTFELEYLPASDHLIIDYLLPEPEIFPKIKEYKFIKTKKEIKEYYLTDAARRKMFDNSIYEITLRTLHEIFEADQIDGIKMISFNGHVDFINKSNGKKEQACIVSIQCEKNEFMQIDLAHVDPKICFKSLKGVASPKLYGLTPVKPLLTINKNDSRFVQSYLVADELDSSSNLAAMDWEDFEHLIRELFEKVFKSNGGEVNITRASKDGGVDAIAFDPDPIRGGKIVIQAKRYTNTVGVSSVRDLYGTLLNEGATKGILVTTANFGNDAYSFAKDKPITLLNGSNLLHLLKDHGYNAKIDIDEAKRIAREKL